MFGTMFDLRIQSIDVLNIRDISSISYYASNLCLSLKFTDVKLNLNVHNNWL